MTLFTVQLEYQRGTMTYLVLSRLIQRCPIEKMLALNGIRFSRVPSIEHLKFLVHRAKSSKEMTQIDISKLFYLIDNQGNLALTNKTLCPFFSKPTDWKGNKILNIKTYRK